MDLHYPPLSPAFAVSDAAKAIDFYKQAFGAERYRLIDPERKDRACGDHHPRGSRHAFR